MKNHQLYLRKGLLLRFFHEVCTKMNHRTPSNLMFDHQVKHLNKSFELLHLLSDLHVNQFRLQNLIHQSYRIRL